jgi:hypothetical protein
MRLRRRRPQIKQGGLATKKKRDAPDLGALFFRNEKGARRLLTGGSWGVARPIGCGQMLIASLANHDINFASGPLRAPSTCKTSARKRRLISVT